jgi:hypothetical protein
MLCSIVVADPQLNATSLSNDMCELKMKKLNVGLSGRGPGERRCGWARRRRGRTAARRQDPA